MSIFKFENGTRIKNKSYGQHGQIIARAEFMEGGNRYLVKHRDGYGRDTEGWWTEAEIELDTI